MRLYQRTFALFQHNNRLRRYFLTKNQVQLQHPLVPLEGLSNQILVIKNSLLKMTTIGKKFGEHIWLGYQKKYPTQKQTMYNVYTNVPAMIQPYQKDEFENCAGKTFEQTYSKSFQPIHQNTRAIPSSMFNVINATDNHTVHTYQYAWYPRTVSAPTSNTKNLCNSLLINNFYYFSRFFSVFYSTKKTNKM